MVKALPKDTHTKLQTVLCCRTGLRPSVLELTREVWEVHVRSQTAQVGIPAPPFTSWLTLGGYLTL